MKGGNAASMEPTLSTVGENSEATSGEVSPETDDVAGVLSYEQWVVKNMEIQQFVPSFMMDDESEKLGDLMEEILFHHKCYNCYKFLCCGGNVFHEVNCWGQELKQDMTIYGIQQIYKYRIDVLRGCMKDWKEWAFEGFQREKHFMRWRFGPQHIGLFVRCFKCEVCCVKDGKSCHVLYHKHC